MRNSCKPIQGFTLLELLIAISIFATIGIASYRVLSVVMTSETRISEQRHQLEEIQRVMRFMAADIGQMVKRPIRGPYGETQPALTNESSPYRLELTRQGWRNAFGLPRSELQRVAYEIGAAPLEAPADEVPIGLLRHYWQVLDQAQDSQPETQFLSARVKAMEVRFLDELGNWQSSWPPLSEQASLADELPVALEIVFDTQDYGSVRRLYDLRDRKSVV